MDLKKLPPSMLVLLGLGCPGVQACLSPPVDSAEASSSEVESNTVGPCLIAPIDTSASETYGTDTTGTGSSGSGTSSGSETGSGSDTGSSSGSGSGSGGEGSTTVVPCLAGAGLEPDHGPDALEEPTSSARVAKSRREALEWVLHSLPTDIAARLRKTIP